MNINSFTFPEAPISSEPAEGSACPNTAKSFIPQITTASSTAFGPLIGSPTTKNFRQLPDNVCKVNQLSDLSSFDLIIDIRPYNCYSQAHIRSSINICIPTTLLKRSSLDLSNILNLVNIPQHYKDRLLSKISQKSPQDSKKFKVLFYDGNSCANHISLSLFQTIMKFNQFPDVFSIQYLEGGFQAASQHSISPQKRESMHSLNDSVESSSSSPVTTNSTFSNGLLDSNDDLIEYTTNTPPESPQVAFNDDKNFLSGFKLPSSTNFKTKFVNSIKKNSLFDDKIKYKEASSAKDYHYNFKYPEGFDNKSISQFRYYPNWMGFITGSNQSLISNLVSKFNKIERSEKLRLSSLISNYTSDGAKSSKKHLHLHSPSTDRGDGSLVCTPNGLCPDCDDINYKMPKGIEYGFKNRYNNIWPYEHSRVKINTPSEDDYFNANYIESGAFASKVKYIATQNPLKDTVKDFWKIVDHENIKIVISLDSAPLVYLKDDSQVYSVEIISSSPTTIVRKINNDIFHISFNNWPDFGVPQDFDSILALIQLKNNLLESEINPEFNKILVHCSAGCGRTGVFITIDSLIDAFRIDSKRLLGAKEDLVYKLVQNQRKQRLSMVQNLDQYIVCYEIFLYYLSKVDTTCEASFGNFELGSSARIGPIKGESLEDLREHARTAEIGKKNYSDSNGDYFSGLQGNYTNVVRSN